MQWKTIPGAWFNTEEDTMGSRWSAEAWYLHISTASRARRSPTRLTWDWNSKLPGIQHLHHECVHIHEYAKKQIKIHIHLHHEYVSSASWIRKQTRGVLTFSVIFIFVGFHDLRTWRHRRNAMNTWCPNIRHGLGRHSARNLCVSKQTTLEKRLEKRSTYPFPRRILC